MTVKKHKIGIISDTHGVLPYKIHEVFEGVDQIIHAGDIGSEDIITELEVIAPVSAVFGNTDNYAIRKKIKGKNGYVNYAAKAKSLALTAGGLWSSFRDWPHVQLRSASNPGRIYTLEQIDREMKKRFGN